MTTLMTVYPRKQDYDEVLQLIINNYNFYDGSAVSS